MAGSEAVSTSATANPARGACVPLTQRPRAVSLVACGLGAGAFAVYPFGLKAFVAAGLAVVLVVVSASDLERRIIPNRVVLPAIPLVLLGQVASSPGRTPEYILAMLGAALFLMLPILLNPSAIGMGDVKLAALLGAGLGLHVVDALALGFVLLAPVALATLVRGGMAARKTALPMGPFLALGGFMVLIAPPLLGLGTA